MFPPHGPPGPETHPHAPFALDALSQRAPVGHAPPHAPEASVPHAAPQNAAGPGQQLRAPDGDTHRQSCSHAPFTHRSAVQPLSSLQSASLAHTGGGVGFSTGMHWQLPSAAAAH